MSTPGFNKVLLIGNAGQDAEVKSTPNGKRVANFPLAINSFENDFSSRRDRGFHGDLPPESL
jgi:single-stranded DNA-binding protein